jgi:hypothetical protein
MAHSECCPEKSVGLRALLGLGHVRDIRARYRDVAARQAIDHSRHEEHGQAVRRRKHREADDGADQAEDQDRAPTQSIGQGPEDRSGNQLRKGK